jgi:hypothetical protein
LLKNDIDELTKSNEYHQVSKKMLNQLFGINKLRSSAFPYHVKEAITRSLYGLRFPFMWFGFIAICSILIYTLCHVKVGIDIDLKGLSVVLGVLSFIGCGIGSICGFVNCFISDRRDPRVQLNYDFIKVALEMEPIKQTKVKIPLMAKLKIKEAKDSELFEDFTIAYPRVTLENKKHWLGLHKKVDPVILGVTKDERMFMVCWWDVKHEVDRAQTDLNMFKKYKVE